MRELVSLGRILWKGASLDAKDTGEVRQTEPALDVEDQEMKIEEKQNQKSLQLKKKTWSPFTRPEKRIQMLSPVLVGTPTALQKDKRIQKMSNRNLLTVNRVPNHAKKWDSSTSLLLQKVKKQK